MDDINGINPPPGFCRMLDASLNRAAEGLRVLEDIARMILNDLPLTREFKYLRHNLEQNQNIRHQALLSWRNSQGDVGHTISSESSARHDDILSLVTANAHRSEQALRTIEELARLPDSGINSCDFEELRFKLYSLEQTLASLVMRREKLEHMKGLCVILDSVPPGKRSHLELASIVLEAGVKIIQLREQNVPDAKILDLACHLRKLCDSYGAMLIIQGRLDIALASGASGLHLGQKDIPLATARKYLPAGMLIGVSVESAQQAQVAQMDGADYVAPQAVFETRGRECHTIGLDTLKAIRAAVSIPLVAIGGINVDNIAHVIKAGADSVGVISPVALSPDPARAARELIEHFSPDSCG
ncbi:MAG: thiamine phosphate synthase [Dehalococcoidales bacterium]|nr:thiamine phosphate synthase [Dehalococcoidales bacterium]MDD4465597.1 thiamine phosphate synthase [Dehalococcoidales bacterium]